MLKIFIEKSLQIKSKINFSYKKEVFVKSKKDSIVQIQKNLEENIQKKSYEKAQKAAERVQLSTPRIVGGLTILVSIPQFLSIWNNMWNEYQQKEFLEESKKTVDWINMKTGFTIATILGLQIVKYIDNKAKHKVPFNKKFLFLMSVPFLINLLSISYINIIDKKMLYLSYLGSGSMLMIEAQLCNQGMMPFWAFNMRQILVSFQNLK